MASGKITKISEQNVLYTGYANTGTITLSGSLLDYEFITIIHAASNEQTNYRAFNTIPVSEIISGIANGWFYSLYSYTTRYCRIKFLNQTKVNIILEAGDNTGICKIIGSIRRPN